MASVDAGGGEVGVVGEAHEEVRRGRLGARGMGRRWLGRGWLCVVGERNVGGWKLLLFEGCAVCLKEGKWGMEESHRS